MPKLKLFIADYNVSSWSLRAWLPLRQSGLAFETERFLFDEHFTSPEFRRVSPSGQVPCLHVDGFPIWDSLAIGEYVAEITDGPALWPADRRARARARSIAAEMHASFRSLPKELRLSIAERRPTPTLSVEGRADVERILEIWRSSRREFGADGPFLFGRFSIADAMFAPVVTRFTTYRWPVDPEVQGYMDAIWSLPGMQEWRALAVEEFEARKSAEA